MLEREMLRTELHRMLAERTYERDFNDNGSIRIASNNFNYLILRNLQLNPLVMGDMSREFTENDYEMLANLDGSGRRTTEKSQILIS